MLKLLLAPLVILGIGFGLWGATQDLFTGYSHLDHEWSDGSFPLGVDLLSIGQTGDVSQAEARAAAGAALAAWNSALDRTVFVEGAGAGTIEIRVMGGESAVAYTDIRGAERAADAFRITANTSHRFSTSSEGESGAYDLETVLIHEFGHVLGLAHPIPSILSWFGDYGELVCLVPPASGRVMCPRLQGQVMRSPSADDVAGVKALYGW